MRCWCWPGHTNDQQVLPEVKDGMRDWRLGRVVTVVDRGFSSTDNLDYLRRVGGHFIAGERMRSGAPLVEQALSRQGRYQSVRDNLRVKQVRLDGSPGRRWIICHNPDEAQREKATRDAALERVAAELERITTIRDRAAKASKTTGRKVSRNKDKAAHVKAECALRDHRAGPVAAAAAVGPAGPRPEEGRRGGTTRREVPAVHL